MSETNNKNDDLLSYLKKVETGEHKVSQEERQKAEERDDRNHYSEAILREMKKESNKIGNERK
ncbi:hypothetical protein [Rickettsiales endosymbiont of Stachyamoeba lipophora]|uniref:hypothetical protein n=1 Tax=Rickettsiales endosymbiont of Stachyamoeba lipophora TaxID=2486578 RepID=UPI000F64762E|nr:hypothetical protein [Rickettsiales endosymbiont of Stachyamoeba lipophora]AZL15763.1 hypothetical protein EF513_04285 [Rickettsiales endosymbiont of Stachyamoeba lipophora]